MYQKMESNIQTKNLWEAIKVTASNAKFETVEILAKSMAESVVKIIEYHGAKLK